MSVTSATAISMVQYAGKHSRTNECYDDAHVPIYRSAYEPTEPDFLDGMEDGCYWHTDDSLEAHLQLGKYTDFDKWRDILCQLVHGQPLETYLSKRRKTKGEDFYELLAMKLRQEFYPTAVLGTKTAKKLQKDFNGYAERVKNRVEKNKGGELPDQAWLNDYLGWEVLLKVAADAGVLFLD